MPRGRRSAAAGGRGVLWYGVRTARGAGGVCGGEIDSTCNQIQCNRTFKH